MWTSHVVFVLILFVSQFGAISNDAIVRRLSRDIVPVRYTVRLDTKINPFMKNFDFDGNVLIEVNITKPVTTVALHAEKLKLKNSVFLGPQHPLLEAVSESTVWSNINEIFSAVEKFGIKGNTSIEKSDGLISITEMNNDVFPAGLYLFYFNYSGIVGDLDREGFFKDSFISSNNVTEWIVSTVFETSNARRAFPCFDEPGLKSRFRIILSRHDSYSALSNMPSARVEPMETRENWLWEYFHETPPMSTYLVAFFIGRYGFWESENGIRLWAGTTNNTSAEWILQKGDAAFHKLQSVFGPNPLPKQDLLAIPHFTAGLAVENWGISTFRQDILLGGDSRSKRKQGLEVLIHELIHNWLGNLVTPKWWDDVWFSEGFTVYYTTTTIQTVMPEWNLITWDTSRYLQETLFVDSQIGSKALAQPVINKEDLEVGHLNYCKGFLLARLVNITIGGDEVLGKAISQYVKNNQFSLFSREDFWDTIENITTDDRNLTIPVPLKLIMEPWLELPGFPLIRVNRDINGTIIITQEKYIKKAAPIATPKMYKNEGQWWIPITLIMGPVNSSSYKLTTSQYWLQPGQKLIINDPNPDNSSWLLINPDVPVPCHVLYDDVNLDKLENIDYTELPELLQSQIVSDVCTLAMDDLIPLPLAFKVIERILSKTKSPSVWRIALFHLRQVYILLHSTPAQDILKLFIQRLITPQFMRLRLTYPDEEPFASELLRSHVAETACHVNFKECLKDVGLIFKIIMYNKTLNSDIVVREEIKPTVYCTGIEFGGQKEWGFLWEKVRMENDRDERKSLLEGLACSKNTKLLKRYLTSSINNSSTLQFKSKKERKLVLRSVAKNPVAVDVALDFMVGHKNEIKKTYSRAGRKYNWRKVANAIAPLITNEEQISKLQLVLQNVRSSPLTNNVISSARWAIEWRLNNTKVVMDSLQ